MSRSSSPQAKEMADESMVRNLAAQAEAIWPQEEPIFDRHPLGDAAVLDVGCGTGEIIIRLATKYPRATFTGVDLEEPHLARAAERCAAFGARVRFQRGDALALPFADASFDLVTCRHLVQAVPDAKRVLAEIRRVLRPGGRLVILEFSSPRGLMGVLYRAYSRLVLPRVGGWISGDRGAYAYLPASVARFPSPPEFGAALVQAGFFGVRWRPLTGGIAHVFEGERR